MTSKFLALARSIADSAASTPTRANAILSFWYGTNDGWGLPDTIQDETAARTAYFSTCSSKSPIWFGGGEALDTEIKATFHEDIVKFEEAPEAMKAWASPSSHPRAGVALVLLLDQLTRNMFRGYAKTFAFDQHAREATLMLFSHPQYNMLRPVEKLFLLLPLEHHEELSSHDLFAVKISEVIDECTEAGEDAAAMLKLCLGFKKFDAEHREVLEQFGRYPHRNAMLGRENTPAETTYLASGGKTWGAVAKK